MPIKWNITAEAMKARGYMDQISSAYRKFNEQAPEHLADVTALGEQLGEMQSDLTAAANVMGNSGGQSEQPKQPETPKAQTAPPAAPSLPQAQPAPLTQGS